MLHLVTGTVEQHEYMQDERDDAKRSTQTLIIDAIDRDDAETTFEAHFKDKGNEYGTWYSVQVQSAHALVVSAARHAQLLCEIRQQTAAAGRH